MFASRLAKSLMLATIALGTSFLTGCVGQGDYDNLYETNRSLTDKNAQLERELAEARASLDRFRGSNVGAEGALAGLQRENDELRRQRDQALADLKSLEGRMAGLDFGRLDAETDRALSALAAQYPDLIKYDAARGMLRFASDLTFDSGSDAVKPEAMNALGALAQILNSSAAAQYEVWIEGHTDSQRISAKTAPRHPTNRHLSAHRAISVISELGKRGVNNGKMMAAGWGEFRPAVSNTASGNTPANRRVEIFLAKAREGNNIAAPDAPAATPTTANPDNAATPTRQPDITK